MARPTIRIDKDELLRWAKTGASQAEIAQRLGVSRATIERRLQSSKFREILEIGRGEMMISLRAKQVQIALAGNVQMLKWLGEQYLGQAHAHKLVDQQGEDVAPTAIPDQLKVIIEYVDKPKPT